MKGISLYQLNNQIKSHLSDAFSDELWVVAEISELRQTQNGHCYLELIEKDENTDQITAKARATIWAYTFRMLHPYFKTSTGQTLASGIKVLIKVSVEFQEIYGYSLNIKDIDPSFTLGDIERRRREILRKLENEGIMNMNKDVQMPFHPKKIAVISSPTAAGYGDFVNQLENNPSGFYFVHKLFPAIMQGEKATESIIQAFDRIYAYEDFFDVVVLIRGGGSTTDLSCFDTYELALNITQFPLPVIAGIGHERDMTIADTVAHTRVKTPTAAASFIINKVSEIETFVIDRETRFLEGVNDVIYINNEEIKHLSEVFVPKVKTHLRQELGRQNLLKSKVKAYTHSYLREHTNKSKHLTDNIDKSVRYKISRSLDKLVNYPDRIKRNIQFVISNGKRELENYQTIITLSDPHNLLKKGYSLTYADGVLVKDIGSIKIGQEIITKSNGGEISSTVTEIIKNK